MKKYIFMAVSAAVLGLTSCSDSVMDDINKNEGNPSGSLVSANLQITDAIMSTAFSTVSGDYAFYTSSVTEQEFGTGNNQLMKAELRNPNELAATSTFNNVWNSTYGNLLNIKEMIEKVEKGTASSAGMNDVLGAAQVLWVLNFEMLTDMHGDVPYTEALQGAANMAPHTTSQEDIYTDLLKVLDNAIENLTAAEGMANMADYDIAFHGDTRKWLAAAYALKARLHINMTCVDDAAAQKAYDAATNAEALGFNGFTVSEFNGVTCDNPWSAFVWSRGYIACSKTVTDLFDDTDPRLVLYTNGEDPADVAAEPGDEAMAIESWTWCYPMYYDLGAQPVHLMSAHELYFILAEAELRLGLDATEDFQKAVALSVNEQSSWFGEDCEGDDFAATLGDATLEKVFVQKYLAGIVDEQVITYNDLRRCKGMNENYITLTNPKNVQGGMNRWPYLLPYGQSTVTNNPNMKVVDVYEKQCWLFGGK